MIINGAPIYIGCAIASIVGVALYCLYQLRQDPEPSAILLAEEKQRGIEQKKREKLSSSLSRRRIELQEKNLTFQCCDIESIRRSDNYLQSIVPNKADIDEGDLSYSPRLLLRVGESQYGAEYKERLGQCAICMDDFKVGDIIVDSIDEAKCPHVYHFDCILTWFIKSTNDSGSYHCPMCRQLFVMD